MIQPGALDRPSAGARRLILVLGAMFYAAGTFGSNIGPAWIDKRPAVVLALSSRNRNLFASVPFIEPLPYSLIGFVRVATVAVVLYLAGRWYGGKALGWMEGQLGELPTVYRWAQTGVDRAGWLLVLLMPGSNIVCLLAGHRRMALRRFMPMLLIGTALKLVVLWIGGQIFKSQIRSFLNYIEDYQWWVVGGLFAITFVQSGFKARKSVARMSAPVDPPKVSDVDPTPTSGTA
ncbi:MAG: hypothetical protein ABIQ39_11760 [Ilumatobacteraceae bacterium]